MDLLIPLQPRTQDEKSSFTADSRNVVLEDAFKRCLTELERETHNEEYIQYQAKKQHNTWKATEAKKQNDYLTVKKELNDFLDAQVHEFEARQTKERVDRRNAEITNIIQGNNGV
jgi:hypothetical protein